MQQTKQGFLLLSIIFFAMTVFYFGFLSGNLFSTPIVHAEGEGGSGDGDSGSGSSDAAAADGGSSPAGDLYVHLTCDPDNSGHMIAELEPAHGAYDPASITYVGWNSVAEASGGNIPFYSGVSNVIHGLLSTSFYFFQELYGGNPIAGYYIQHTTVDGVSCTIVPPPSPTVTPSGCGNGTLNDMCVVIPPSTGTVQGYKVDANSQAYNFPATISVAGQSSSGVNPYFIYNVPAGLQWIQSSPVSNYMIGHNNVDTGKGWIFGDTAYENVPAGGALNLYWIYLHGNVYCTGGSDPNGNNWQYWQWADFASGRASQYYAPGDAGCAPPVVPSAPNGSLTNVTNPCNIAVGQTTCQPYFDWTTANTNGVIQFNIVGGSYSTESYYASTAATSGTGGHGAALAAGSYTIKLYGQNSANQWVLLDQKPVVVIAPTTASPNLTAGPVSPTWAVVGTPQTFSARVTNTGTGSTGVSFNNLFQVATGFDGAGNPTGLGTLGVAQTKKLAATPSTLLAVVMGALGGGSSATASVSYTFSTAGTYYVRMCADKASAADQFGAVDEGPNHAGEYDNCGSWAGVGVTASSNPPPTTPPEICVQSTNCQTITNTPLIYQWTGTPTQLQFSWNCPTGVQSSTGFSTGGANSGTVTVTPSYGTPYSVLCNGGSGPYIITTAPPTPTITFTAPVRVRAGGTVTLNWSATNAAACTLQNVTAQPNTTLSALLTSPVGGLQLSNFTGQTTYTLTCTNGSGASMVSAAQTRVVKLTPAVIER